MISQLEKIFNANSIAIVGASETPGKAGERRTRSLIEGGFQGKIYPINPKRDSIFSLKAYPNLKDVEDDEVDLVMVAVPVSSVPSVIQESVEKKAKGVVVITAGFGETGKHGKCVERKLLDIARKANLRIIGPNCSGIFNAQKNINLLGIPFIQKGPFSIVAQSGNVIGSICHYARLRNIGFSKIASIGNSVDLGFSEYLEFLRNDPSTKVILLYMEGIKNGNKFIEVAREVSMEKPIVAIKTGSSEAGRRAVCTHTGSIAGDERIVKAALDQAGIIRVYSVDEMFDVANTLVNAPRPNGKRVVILSEGGGDNAIMADNVMMQGLQVDPLSKETREKLKPYLLNGLIPSNPIDYGGKAEENPHKVIPACCEVCMKDSNVDMIILTGFFGGYKDIIAPHVVEFEKETSRKLVELVKKYEKPILVHTSFANEKIDSISILKEGGIPVMGSSDRVARCAAALVKTVENQRRSKYVALIKKEPSPESSVLTLINRVRDKSNNMLETESREILEKYGIPIPKARLVKNRSEAVEAAEELGYPVVLKICSRDIIHKSDIGGVKIDLRTREAVESGFEEIMKRARRHTSRIDGVLVVQMMPQGQECIVGMTRDKQFGPVLLFGLGGIFTEILKDYSIRILPVAEDALDRMIKEIEGFPILSGARGGTQKDVSALKDILQKVSNIAIDYPDIKEMDLNPVVVYEKGGSVLDSLIILRR